MGLSDNANNLKLFVDQCDLYSIAYGPKLYSGFTTVRVLMKISEICQYFLLKKCERLLHCKSFSHFF